MSVDSHRLSSSIRHALYPTSSKASASCIPLSQLYSLISEESVMTPDVWADLVTIVNPFEAHPDSVDSIDLLTGQYNVATLDWQEVPKSNQSMTQLGTMRRWPLNKKQGEGSTLYIATMWYGFSLYLPLQTLIQLSSEVSSASYTRKVAGTLSKSPRLQALPGLVDAIARHLVSTVKRYDADQSGGTTGSSDFGTILSATWLAPYSIVARPWDSQEGNLTAPNTISAITKQSVLLATTQDQNQDQNQDENNDLNKDSNVDVNVDANGTTSSTNDPVSEVTSTSTSNAGSATAVAIGPKSAAAATASHGPTVSLVQTPTTTSTTSQPSSPTNSTSSKGGPSFKASFSLLKIVLGKGRGGSTGPFFDLNANREQKVAVATGGVAVAVPGAAASASTSASSSAAGNEAEVDSNAVVAGNPSPVTNLHQGQGKVQQSFEHSEVERPIGDSEAEGMGVTTRTIVTTVTTTDVQRIRDQKQQQQQ